MQVVQRKISDVQPYGKNAKKHPEEQIQQIADSIRAFGFNQPLVIDKAGVIIVGHGRYMAAQLLGLEDVPVVEVDISEEQARGYRLADNKLNESPWDMELVVAELKELSVATIDLTGFDRSLVLDNPEKNNAVPPTPEDPKSRLGDIYELGGHRVLCGDATKQADMALLMNGIKADMVLTDPPYNVDLGIENLEEAKVRKRRTDGLSIKNDKMEDGEFRSFLSTAFTHMDANLKPGGVFYIWHADSEGYNFRGACNDVGWKVRQCLVWNKNALVMGRQDYQWKHEPCLYGWKDGASHLWNADRTQTTILNFDRPSKSGSHPTMKPVELLAYQIGNNTKGEDIVLDCFLGSGSTLIAAEKTGRFCYGTELDPRFVDVIVQRYVDFTGIRDIKKNGEAITW